VALVIIGNVVFALALVTAVSNLQSKTSFPYDTEVSMGFALPSHPDVMVATVLLFLHTTAQGVSGFSTNEPITMEVNAYFLNSSLDVASTYVFFGFKDAGTLVNKTFYLPQVNSFNIGLKPRTNAIGNWNGSATIMFQFQGAYPPRFRVQNSNGVYDLQEMLGFQLLVSPTNYQLTFQNELNDILAGAIVFFGVVESLLLIVEIWPKAFEDE
jgi:hypothetical protein